jgi:hypothetical protein
VKSARGSFAVERGLVAAGDGETRVRIRMLNTHQPATATLRTPGGRVRYAGESAMPGVPGAAAPVVLDLAAPCADRRPGRRSAPALGRARRWALTGTRPDAPTGVRGRRSATDVIAWTCRLPAAAAAALSAVCGRLA